MKCTEPHLAIIFATLIFTLSPRFSYAAEVWVSSVHERSDFLPSAEPNGCSIITHNCEICVTTIGTGEIACSQRSAECVPSEWSCFKGISNGDARENRHLRYSGTQLNTARSAGPVSPKQILDRVVQIDVADDASDKTDFEQPSSLQSTRGPLTKQFYDRLTPSD